MRAPKDYNILLHIGFWLVLFAFPLSFGVQNGDFPLVLQRISLPFTLQIGIAYLNLLVLVPKLLNRKRLGWYLLVILSILVSASRLMRWWFTLSLNQEKLAQPLPGSDLTFGDIPLPLQLLPPLLFTFMILFISTVYALAIDKSRKEKETALLEKKRTEAELKFLRAQINPHFFFNALNNLYSTIKLKPQQSDLFIKELSEMMRYVIYECNKDRIALTRELEVINSYLFFHRIKDEERVDITFNHDIADKSAQIEPMLVIPLLENVFKHGYSTKDAPLMVKIELENTRLSTHIRVENTIDPQGLAPNTAPSETGVGLVNIRQRLQHCYPNKHSFETVKTEDRFIADLTIAHD